MNFILSKIMNRPKSVVLSSADSTTVINNTNATNANHQMDNKETLEVGTDADVDRPTLIEKSASPSPIPPILISNPNQISIDGNSNSAGNCNDNDGHIDSRCQNNELQGSNKSFGKKSDISSTDNNPNITTATTTINATSTTNNNIETSLNTTSVTLPTITTTESVAANDKISKELEIELVTDKGSEKEIDENTLLILKAKQNFIENELNDKEFEVNEDKNQVIVSNVLPDIINVPSIKESDNLDESLISSLTNNLNNLNLNSTKEISHLNVPSSTNNNNNNNCDVGGISSDEEFYAECQTFTTTESTKNVDNIITNTENVSNQNHSNDNNANISDTNTINNKTSDNISIKSNLTILNTKDNNEIVLQENTINSNLDLYMTTSIDRYRSNDSIQLTQESEFISATDLLGVTIINSMDSTQHEQESIDQHEKNQMMKDDKLSQASSSVTNFGSIRETLESDLYSCISNSSSNHELYNKVMAQNLELLSDQAIPNEMIGINSDKIENRTFEEVESICELQTPPVEILFDVKQQILNRIIRDSGNDDSLDSEDIYIPQILLRQTDKEKYQDKHVTNNDLENLNVKIKCTESLEDIDREQSSNSNNKSNISDSSSHRSTKSVQELPISEMKLHRSTDSNLSTTSFHDNMLITNQEINEFPHHENKAEHVNKDIINLSLSSSSSSLLSAPLKALNQTVNILPNYNIPVTHSDDSFIENVERNETIDNANSNSNTLFNIVTNPPEYNDEFPTNITFAASSEALNSTFNFSSYPNNNIKNKMNNLLLDNSFEKRTVTTEIQNNFNETILIDEKNNTKSISNSSAMKNSSNQKEDEAVVVVNREENEYSNSFKNLSIERNSDNTSNLLPNNILNTSVEPMDVDIMSPKHQNNISPRVAKFNEINEIEYENENKEFNCSVQQQNAFNDKFDYDFDFKVPFPPFPSSQSPSSSKNLNHDLNEFTTDENFQTNVNNILFSPTDFDFLLTKGNHNTPIDRNSLLLRFDPLLGHAVPVNQVNINNNNNNQHQQQQQQNKIQNKQSSKTSLLSLKRQTRLSPPIEIEDEDNNIKNSLSKTVQIEKCNEQQQEYSECNNSSIKQILFKEKPSLLLRPIKNNKNLNISQDNKSDDKMSADVIQDINIENDITKSIDNLSCTQSEEKQDYKMEDLEKKIKNEVLKTEDIEKKLKDAEQREENLLKRITEKDKIIAKSSGVIEAYEKTLAETIAEKEQIKQNYEKQIAELKADRDSNYQHLLSLETTFSDLHVKYERSKQTTEKLRKSEEDLLTEKRQAAENLRLQEQRYEKMKSHALQQLEIANNKLDNLSKTHSAEVIKLKALLKKEEISRLSVTEQLQQKIRENEELMKICDELIARQGPES